MRCDACGWRGKRTYKIECCKELILCKRCAEVDLVKETNDPSEMVAIIKISLKEAQKRFKRR